MNQIDSTTCSALLLLATTYVHGIWRGFNRQRKESRGKLEDGGTKRTTTQVLNIIQKVPELVIHLKVDEEPKSVEGHNRGVRGRWAENARILVKILPLDCSITQNFELTKADKSLVNGLTR